MIDEHDYSLYVETLSVLATVDERRMKAVRKAEMDAKAAEGEVKENVSSQMAAYAQVANDIETVDRALKKLRNAFGFSAEPVPHADHTGFTRAYDFDVIQRDVAAVKKETDRLKDNLRLSVQQILFGSQEYQSRVEIIHVQQRLAHAARDIDQTIVDLDRLRFLGRFSADSKTDLEHVATKVPHSLTTAECLVTEVKTEIQRIEVELPSLLERRKKQKAEARTRWVVRGSIGVGIGVVLALVNVIVWRSLDAIFIPTGHTGPEVTVAKAVVVVCGWGIILAAGLWAHESSD